MPKYIKRVSKKSGMLPGTLVHIGEKKVEKVKITVIDYDAERFEEKEFKNIEDVFEFKDSPLISWINIDGVHNVDVVKKIGDHFKIHPLALEDVMNTAQRPKFEDFGEYVFLVIKMLYTGNVPGEIVSEQISLIVGENFVISFQERTGDVFETVRERIRTAKGRIRQKGSDYLAYSLIDAVVDNYFSILEALGEKVEKIEETLIKRPSSQVLQTLQNLKRDAIFLRKAIWPLREAISALTRGESSVIKESTIIYLRNVYDHAVQVIDTVETFRDLISGLLDIYLSSLSNKMNEVMKVLTIFASIFIPLTFVAGIYGMNFKYMPELEWRYGYFIVLGGMFVIGISLLIAFKRKKWF
ncbi:MAG: magnesium/cobalt transporter CorA [Candidatus Omnitrophota bacterium]